MSVGEKKAKLLFDNDKVIAATISDGKLEIEYADGWQEWFMHPGYKEFKQTVDALNAKLASSKGGQKGAGKKGSKAGKGKGSR